VGTPPCLSVPPPHRGGIFGIGAGTTSATMTDGGVFGFIGTARPVWLNLMCIANQPGVLNTLEHPATGQCNDSAPSGPVLLPEVVTTLLAGSRHICPVAL
jgi:hypothetical protein